MASLTSLEVREDQVTDTFWISQLNKLRHEILEVQRLADGHDRNLQVAQGPTSNKTSAPKAPLARGRADNKTSIPQTHTKQKMLATTDSAVVMGNAMLSPMMGMLKGYVQEQKSRIGELNKMEEADKKKFARRKAEHEKRLKRLEDRHQHGMEKKAYEKALWQENHNFKKVAVAARERHKRSFHNTLKMIHGMMAKEKTMISAYKEAIPAEPESKEHKKKPAKLSENEPEVVLVQDRAAVSLFCSEALTKIQEELRHLALAEAEIEQDSQP